MFSSLAVNKTMYKIATLGSQHGLRSESVLQSCEKEFQRKMRGLAYSCCACNYNVVGKGTYSWVPLGKSNSQVDLDKVQKSLLKSTFVPAFVHFIC